MGCPVAPLPVRTRPTPMEPPVLFDPAEEAASQDSPAGRAPPRGEAAQTEPKRKRTTRARPARARKKSALPDDGKALFLGWDGTEHVPTLGFRPSAASKPDRPALTYTGD